MSERHVAAPCRLRGWSRTLPVALSAWLLACLLFAAGLGSVEISPAQVVSILLEKIGLGGWAAYDDVQAAVLEAIRLPRVVMAALVGAGLASSGAALQGLYRNPLADPGLLGISSGAARPPDQRRRHAPRRDRHQRALRCDALLLGEANARHLGVSVETVKTLLVLLVLLIARGVDAGVAVSGMIGFVGLVVPHLIRFLTGPNHRLVLPNAALLGASLLVLADLLARTVVAPLELPLGIVTSALGAPFFLFLLLRKKRTGEL